ncbi:hypothetical protein [Saccharothrix texasensis]|uniref:Uncharacterized protein n=1 Tax=Saccharothrix texasensis TaxID=103734 RepID=A0A3N1H185_9PSEU|nr:hypothetical protein [Saccharothrix texasensis]ROP36301.1 hypothetical protein EDD40_1566 [Saccharothrix texasensis]
MITATSFPTPDLARRDPGQDLRVQVFAELQADRAESVRLDLARDWHRLTRLQRVEQLRRTYDALIDWRYHLAAAAPGRLGAGIPMVAERFRTAITRDEPRIDRVGYLGRLRHGATWDEHSRTYVGGTSTPAHEIMLHYGRVAHARMDAAPVDDVLVNRIVLPDGREVLGTTLARGFRATVLAADLVRRVAASGRDASRMETGGDGVYLVTAGPDVRATLETAALYLLADDDALTPDGALPAIQAARYLLVHAPRTYKGSDAVIRVLLVAVGSMLLRRQLVLEHDMDLRCLVGDQASATAMPADTRLAPA